MKLKDLLIFKMRKLNELVSIFETIKIILCRWRVDIK
jgi:hypothetical protein